MDLTKIVQSKSSNGLMMNFMKVLSQLQVLRLGSSRSQTFHLSNIRSVQCDRKTSLPCRDNPMFQNIAHLRPLGKIIYADNRN